MYPGASSHSRFTFVAVVPTLLAILIFAWLYLLVLLYDTLATRNIYQTIALPVYSIAIVLILTIQLNQLQDAFQELLMLGLIDITIWPSVYAMLVAAITIPAVLVCFQIALTIQLRKTFGGVILKQFDADARLRGYYRWFEVSVSFPCAIRPQRLSTYVLKICFALLKLDLFLLAAPAIAFIVIVGDRIRIENYITIAMLTLVFLTIWSAFYVVRHESKVGTSIVLVSTSTQRTSYTLTFFSFSLFVIWLASSSSWLGCIRRITFQCIEP